MERPAAALTGLTPAPAAKLEPDAIGTTQDTIIGMASSAPAATVGLSIAALAAATAYGSGPTLLLTAIPMIVIANAYRRCNMWNARCGASFEWVGRAIDRSLGATMVYYRRRVLGAARDALILGLLPLGAAGFLGWRLARTLQSSPWTQRWSLIGIVAAGLVMLVVTRTFLRSPFFSIRRESETRGG